LKVTTIRTRDARIEDCDALGLITVSASHSTFIGHIPEECLDFSWTPAQSARGWRDSFPTNTDRGQTFRVLERGDRVIGFVWAAPWADSEGYDGSIQGLYVLPTRQRQGLGRKLLRDAVRRLQRGGARSVEIGCVRENPSCGFYRHLGGIEIGRRPVKVDAFQTEEILFGWPDLSSLLG
jgi:ribosomal protein S18 acetylase RimI-like enzyme